MWLIIQMDFIILAPKILYRSVIFLQSFPQFIDSTKRNLIWILILVKSDQNIQMTDLQWDHQPIIGHFVSKNCVKVKEIGLKGGARTWLRLESANDVQYLSSHEINIYTSLQAIFIVKLPHVFQGHNYFLSHQSISYSWQGVCLCFSI